MKSKEVVKEIMAKFNVSQTKLAERMGVKSRQVVGMRLTQNDISIKKLYEMLRVLDYKIVIVPRETRLPDGCYEVES